MANSLSEAEIESLRIDLETPIINVLNRTSPEERYDACRLAKELTMKKAIPSLMRIIEYPTSGQNIDLSDALETIEHLIPEKCPYKDEEKSGFWNNLSLDYRRSKWLQWWRDGGNR